MRILAIDPGYQESALVVYSTVSRDVLEHFILPNNEIIESFIPTFRSQLNCAAIEHIEGFGMAVGREVFETVWWSGRFYQSWLENEGGIAHRVTRKEVKLHLCGSVKATDSNIRQALLDKFAETNRQALGTKKIPGPLYGIKSHEWSALAIAVTLAETTLK